MATAAILPGVVIGAALGLLGGGGSVLAVPIFVYVLGFDPKQAIAMGLAVVAATAAAGTAAHWRAGNVNLHAAVAFGLVALLGTMLGVRLATFVAGSTQLVMFGLAMAVAAASMLRGSVCAGADDRCEPVVPVPLLKIVPAGILVGVLTGLVGVGGGFLIVPALVLMRLPLREAVGTSLLVISANSLVGFLGYLGQVRVDWAAVALVASGTLPGIALGSYLHHFVPQRVLRRSFAAFLVVMATFILYESR